MTQAPMNLTRDEVDVILRDAELYLTRTPEEADRALNEFLRRFGGEAPARKIPEGMCVILPFKLHRVARTYRGDH